MDVSIQSLTKLVAEFERLPGVGRKTAERLAYHVLRAPTDEALGLADAIREVVGRTVDTGPVCAVELPLHFGEKW